MRTFGSWIAVLSCVWMCAGCTQALDVSDHEERSEVQVEDGEAHTAPREALSQAQVEALEEVAAMPATGEALDMERAFLAAHRLSEHYADTGQAALTQQWHERTVELFEQGDFAPKSQAAAIAAKAKFELVDSRFSRLKADCESTQITDEKDLQALMISMVAQMGRLVADYESLGRYQESEWTVAGLSQAGMVYIYFVEHLRPRAEEAVADRLTPDQLEIFRALLDEQLYAIEQRGVAYLQKSVEVADEHSLKSVWAEEARLRHAHWSRKLF